MIWLVVLVVAAASLVIFFQWQANKEQHKQIVSMRKENFLLGEKSREDVAALKLLLAKSVSEEVKWELSRDLSIERQKVIEVADHLFTAEKTSPRCKKSIINYLDRRNLQRSG